MTINYIATVSVHESFDHTVTYRDVCINTDKGAYVAHCINGWVVGGLRLMGEAVPQVLFHHETTLIVNAVTKHLVEIGVIRNDE